MQSKTQNKQINLTLLGIRYTTIKMINKMS